MTKELKNIETIAKDYFRELLGYLDEATRGKKKEVSESAGYSGNYISRLKREDAHDLPFSAFVRIATALGMTPSQLLQTVEQKKTA